MKEISISLIDLKKQILIAIMKCSLLYNRLKNNEKSLRLKFTTIIILFSYAVIAQTVSINEAKIVAKNFLNRKINDFNTLKNGYVVELETDTIIYSQTEMNGYKSGVLNPALYVFSIKNKGGFIITSTNKVIPPILGYSLQNQIDFPSLPPQLSDAFNLWAQKIDSIIKYSQDNEKYTSIWDLLYKDGNINPKIGKVDPLLKTHWGQLYPYNELCPVDPSTYTGGHAYVGCTGTALAQFLKFYNYPYLGKGSTSYTTKYGPISVNFENSHYIWANMPNTISNSNLDVSKLMFDCAAAVNTAFSGTDGSTSDMLAMLNALKNNFSYSKNIIYANSNNYTPTDWINILKESLYNSKPILYSGAGTSSHAMICDGFDGDYFHFNFGWDGGGDGYYLLESLCPSSIYNFSYLQNALLNVQPDSLETTANYYSNQNIGILPLTIEFTNSSTSVPKINNFQWDFNSDGKIDSYLENPKFTFDSAGIYNVTLTIANNFKNDVKFKRNYITVLKDTIGKKFVDAITESSTWDKKDIYITKNIIIPQNTVIQIMPGCNIHFCGKFSIKVLGSLIAKGTKQNPIKFSSLIDNEKWTGIEFSGNQSSILSNCYLNNCENYSQNGNYLTFDSLITIFNDKVIIEYCNISDNSCRGIRINSSPIIRYNNITNNFHSDGAGIMVEGGNPLINNNFISYNNGWNSGAIHLRYCDALLINNYIYNNRQGAVRIFNGNNITITGNIICNNYNIWNLGGGGIGIADGLKKSNIIINNNTICNNYSPGGSALSIFGTNPKICNNIIWGLINPVQGSLIYLNNGTKPIFENCIIEGSNNYIGSSTDTNIYNISNLINCTDSNPMFIKPTPKWDGNDQSVISNIAANAVWNVNKNSLSIDKGLSNVPTIINIDISGRRRIWDGDKDGKAIIDIGALEYNSVYEDTLYFCKNTSLKIHNLNINQTGDYLDSLKSISGVDSIMLYHALEYPLPDKSGIINGASTICQGQKFVKYTVPTISNVTSYIWSLPSGANGNSSTNSITIDYSIVAVSGNISVKGHNDCGDGVISTLPVVVNPIPATPIITQNGKVLHSDAMVGNQWYNQNNPINGATSQDYTITTVGEYTVQVSLNGCVSAPSNMIKDVVTSISKVEYNEKIQVYPNPVTDDLTIKFEGNLKEIKFEIYNSIGQVITTGVLLETAVVHTSMLSSGIYTIKFNTGKTFDFRKIIKHN